MKIKMNKIIRKLSPLILLPLVLLSLHGTHAGYYHHEDGGSDFGGGFEGNNHHLEHVHLGTFVGKHSLPPKVIHVTKTVAVKVPAPYPVEIPHPVPYPVPVPKPYPVHVPKIVKIKEQVPIEVPSHHHHSTGGSSNYGSHDGGQGESYSVQDDFGGHNAGFGGYNHENNGGFESGGIGHHNDFVLNGGHQGFNGQSNFDQQNFGGNTGYGGGEHSSFGGNTGFGDGGHGGLSSFGGSGGYTDYGNSGGYQGYGQPHISGQGNENNGVGDGNHYEGGQSNHGRYVDQQSNNGGYGEQQSNYGGYGQQQSNQGGYGEQQSNHGGYGGNQEQQVGHGNEQQIDYSNHEGSAEGQHQEQGQYGNQGEYSKKNLIYSNPKYGIVAYHSKTPEGSAYHYEANNGLSQEYRSGSQYHHEEVNTGPSEKTEDDNTQEYSSEQKQYMKARNLGLHQIPAPNLPQRQSERKSKRNSEKLSTH